MHKSEMLISSCKNNCLLISHFLPAIGCSRKTAPSFQVDTLVLVGLFSLPSMELFRP